MSIQSARASAFLEYYRCPADMGVLEHPVRVPYRNGFFRFGDAIVFGRRAGGDGAAYATDLLADVTDAVRFVDGRPRLPFDLSEVAMNLRQERYPMNGYTLLQKTTEADAAHRLYYLLRPFMGVGVRKHLQKVRLKGWDRIAFPGWPVDATVDMVMETAMAFVLKARNASRLPFIWFWPDGAPACAMMTHDVEGPRGLNFCDELMDLDDDHGIKSAFQIVPEGQEDAWRCTAAQMRRRRFEVNLHDLNHDGQLFASKAEFLERAKRINEYAQRLGCNGFRSAVMYRQQEWFDAFEFAYDMSVPNSAHLEPQRGGCCTVMPYFVGDLLELPLTTTQDYSLFHILNEYSTRLWREQIRLITRHHGLVSVITHPDYLVGSRERAVYVELLRHLVDLRDHNDLWIALPAQINRWWRNRQEMTLTPTEYGWRIDGPDAHRARVAYATLEDGRVTYEFDAAPVPA